MSYPREILPKIVRYPLAWAGLCPPGLPMNFTFSITNICNSRCRTCKIWKIYREHPERKEQELKIEEIRKIFRSMGHVYIFNISGGEPFLREDIPEIIEAACRYLTPGIIHIPTNALAFGAIKKKLGRILDWLDSNYPRVRLTVKPSLDHVGEKHDEIRGVSGNFKKVLTLFNYLKELKKDYPFLHPELGTVISRWNVDDIEEIAGFVTRLDPDSYRNEIAEERSEMFNQGEGITPLPGQYKQAVDYFKGQIKSNMKNPGLFSRITNGFRLVYYDTAIRIMKDGKQVIPCYAGISNAHMTPYGDIWACCTLGYENSMGNLRDHGFDFMSLWNSAKAREVRSDIKKGQCHCPLANQAYSNLLLDPVSLLKVFREIGRSYF